jgi:putative membrane protein
MMVARALGTVAIVGFLACPALVPAQAGEAELAAQDLAFAKKAAEGGLMEVQLGELAQQQAKGEQVVEFGQRMVQDHGQANEKLRAIAEEKGIQLPQELPEDAQQKYEELQQLSDAEFDQAYMDEMVKDHEKDIELFEQQADAGQDPDLRAFAEETLPTLREHLELAKEVQSQVTAGGGDGPQRKQTARLAMADVAG